MHPRLDIAELHRVKAKADQTLQATFYVSSTEGTGTGISRTEGNRVPDGSTVRHVSTGDRLVSKDWCASYHMVITVGAFVLMLLLLLHTLPDFETKLEGLQHQIHMLEV